MQTQTAEEPPPNNKPAKGDWKDGFLEMLMQVESIQFPKVHWQFFIEVKI